MTQSTEWQIKMVLLLSSSHSTPNAPALSTLLPDLQVHGQEDQFGQQNLVETETTEIFPKPQPEMCQV